MPVQRCQSNGKPGFKWGPSGTCYSYESGDAAGRARARANAAAQGAAARAAGFVESSETECVHCSSEETSKRLTDEVDLSTFSDDELSEAHDESHDLYRVASVGGSGPHIDIVGLHARIVGELMCRKMSHPSEPRDGLDSTTAP